VLWQHSEYVRPVGNQYRVVTRDREPKDVMLTDPMTRGQLERLARFLSIPFEDFYP
jgi:hypothetical protein